MKVTFGALASAALLGGSLFLGAGAAQAFSCPAGQHVISMGGVNDCVPDASGGGTGGNIVYNGGGQPNAPAPAPIQVPAYKNTDLNAPNFGPPPVYVPAQPAPAPAAPQNVPAAPVAGSYRAPAGGGTGTFVAPGNGQPIARTPEGKWVNPETGVPADPGAVAQAEAAEAAPAEAAPAPAAKPAVILPATEVQAVDALRSATATPAEKDAALVIVKAKIESVLDKAIDKALNTH